LQPGREKGEIFMQLAEMLEEVLTVSIGHLIPILELMGVFIVAVGAAVSFFQYIRSGFRSDNEELKLSFAETLALALEFKMGGEILKTVITRTIDEMFILAAIIVLRALLTFVIHWEIKFDKAQHEKGKSDSFLEKEPLHKTNTAKK